jgi:Rrf2 family protein
MMVLARDSQKQYSAGELSQILKVSQAHLAKVMQRLVKEGMVSSTRGPKGGFILGKPAEEISFLSIYEAIEGPMTSVSCLLAQPVCKNRECIFGDLVQNMNRQILERMANTTLASQKIV